MPRFAERKELNQFLVKILATIMEIWISTTADCVIYDSSVSPAGHYCPYPGKILHNTATSQCKLICMHSVNCKAFNRNSTADTCTLLTTACPLAIHDPMMEYVVFRQRPAVECYEWMPRAALDPADYRVIDVTGIVNYVARFQVNGNDVVGFSGPGICYSCLESLRYDSPPQPPCQLLRISPACTSLWVPYTAGDPLPKGAIIGGQTVDGDQVWIIRFSQQGVVISGYYTTGSPHAVAPHHGSCLLATAMDILVIV